MIKILKYGEVENNDIFARGNDELDVSDAVYEIIKTVRKQGDAALYMYSYFPIGIKDYWRIRI